eukprot:5932200-Prymnesium_polylepis.1
MVLLLATTTIWDKPLSDPESSHRELSESGESLLDLEQVVKIAVEIPSSTGRSVRNRMREFGWDRGCRLLDRGRSRQLSGRETVSAESRAAGYVMLPCELCPN